jgi:hypothetical protein
MLLASDDLRPLVLPLVLAGTTETRWTGLDENARSGTQSSQCGHHRDIYDIFEGTEQIQQLVISRAISGMRVE